MMKALNTRFLLSAIALAASCSALLGSANAAPSASLVTAQQQEMDRQALPLLNAPEVQKAREAAMALWGKQPGGVSADAKATLAGAIDEMVYHSLRAGVADDPTHPRVAWTLAPPYALKNAKVPGSRFAGDNPDRIYRYTAADAAYKYEIRGKRGHKPAQHEFSFESTSAISLVSPPLVALYSKDVDVAKDGSFVVTADSTPANGRRNHLQLPAGTKAVLFRDTVVDWSTDYNIITIKRLDGDDKSGKPAARSHDEHPDCMQQDELLLEIAQLVSTYAVIYLVDITEVPDFNRMYELYDHMSVR